MSVRYDKLKDLLKELFQLNRPDLDFGLYRIMHAKSAEVTAFLDEDLLPQVEEAFGQYRSADKAGLEKELGTLIESVEAAGLNPEDSPKVRELRARLEDEAVDVRTLESEVYDHLYRFFRRYYSEGDFLSKRVYKTGVYAIPYEGEEVKLHWANADQYYTKTSEYLRDYAFRLRPDRDAEPMRVHFRLIDAVEGEHGDVKETKDRVFVLAPGGESGRDFVAEEEGDQGNELVIRFERRPATMEDWPAEKRKEETERLKNPKPPRQKDLDELALERILGLSEPFLTPWLVEMGKPHVLTTGEDADYTRLEAHLRRYNARNSFDYFIHKDLGGFLRRELDFYIKNEVMHLDDIEGESVPRVEQYLSKIRVIRRIAGKIIDFLAQLEDFQKKLWLKKKFVVEASWCIRVGCIPDAFYPEIAANEAQREEWVALHAIDELEGEQGDLTRPRYSEPLTPEFVAANPTLMVDTRHFDEDLMARLLEGIGDLDEQTDGVLFHSENFQALSLMQRRFREQVKCVYIDPPYNTGNDGFPYKDRYQHSSWLSSLRDRVATGKSLLAAHGVQFASCDDNEAIRLTQILIGLFPAGPRETLVWRSRNFTDTRPLNGVSADHEYILFFGNDGQSRLRGKAKDFNKYTNPDDDPRGDWLSCSLLGKATAAARPNLHYDFQHPETGEVFSPPSATGWICAQSTMQQNITENRVLWPRKPGGRPRLKVFRSELKSDYMGFPSIIDGTYTSHGTIELRELLGEKSVPFPKPTVLLRTLIEQGTSGATDSILDYFAGSGTTGHAVINLNREDGGQRKFILVEMGDYFDTVLLPRLKKVTFTPEWKDGKPKRLATPEEEERSPRIMKVLRLESYEDTLNNLVTRRTDAQQDILDLSDAQGPGGFREDYLLRYMLDVETRGSASLLDIEAFADPTAYRLKVKRPGSDESREVAIDLRETFNWLIGLTVERLDAPRRFNATFERDAEGRLRLGSALERSDDGPHWLRAVSGTTPDGLRTLVIWRKLTGDPEEDNLVLDAWFAERAYSGGACDFDVIYVNGGSNLGNLRSPEETWRVRLIEEDFQRLMFEAETD